MALVRFNNSIDDIPLEALVWFLLWPAVVATFFDVYIVFVMFHRKHYPNLTQFSAVEILWRRTVSVVFQENQPKLCGNCAFPKILHTSKLGEITSIFAMFHCTKKKLPAKDIFIKMKQIPNFSADLFTFLKEILNERLDFSSSAFEISN